MRIIKLIGNWFLILTVPAWGGLYLFFAFFCGAWKNENNEREMLTGKDWMLS